MTTITEEQLLQLTRIYNTLLTVKTSGEDSFIMTDCMRALQQVLLDLTKSSQLDAEMVGE